MISERISRLQPRTKTVAGLCLLAVVLLIAFGLRMNAFWLPHWRGDQNQYVVLAMKLDRLGLDGYNLREVRLGASKLPGDPPYLFFFTTLGPRGQDGDLITSLKSVGQAYYDEPLHVRAPLFPYLLLVSHRLFAVKELSDAYVVCASNLGTKVLASKPGVIFKAQFWAAIVPFFFNLCFIALTFLIGLRFFGLRTGFYAATIMTMNPVSIMLAHRLLAEDTAYFFGVLSVFLYLIAVQPQDRAAGDLKASSGGRHFWGATIAVAAAGISMGLSVLTKQPMLVGAVAVWIYTVWIFWGDRQSARDLLKSCFRPEFMIYVLATVLVCGFWFFKVWAVYGNPLHSPPTEAMRLAWHTDVTGWFQAVRQRPFPALFFAVSTGLLCPAFFFAWFSLPAAYRFFKGRGVNGSERCLVMMWLWVFVFYVYLSRPWGLFNQGNQEHRYFYMTYPAIAVLAAWSMDGARKVLSAWTRRTWLADAAVLALLGLNAWWTVPPAMNIVFENVMLL